MIFETNRLHVRKLTGSDLNAFHKMQSNPLVMQYTTGIIKKLEGHKIELNELISKYSLADNLFWIYAIERKKDAAFVGTCDLVKEGNDDEIGYRFLQEYWNYSFLLKKFRCYCAMEKQC